MYPLVSSDPMIINILGINNRVNTYNLRLDGHFHCVISEVRNHTKMLSSKYAVLIDFAESVIRDPFNYNL